MTYVSIEQILDDYQRTVR